MITIWQYFFVLYTLGVAGYLWYRELVFDGREDALRAQGEDLDLYAAGLSRWDTLQKVRGVALSNFWGRCERLASVSPVVRDMLDMMAEELEELESGSGE